MQINDSISSTQSLEEMPKDESSKKFVRLHASKGLGFAHGQMLVKMNNEDPLSPLKVIDIHIPASIHNSDLSERVLKVEVDDRPEANPEGTQYGILDVSVDAVAGPTYSVRRLDSPRLIRCARSFIPSHFEMKEEHMSDLQMLIASCACSRAKADKTKTYIRNDKNALVRRPAQTGFRDKAVMGSAKGNVPMVPRKPAPTKGLVSISIPKLPPGRLFSR